MRAATKVGMTFVGQQQRGSHEDEQSIYEPRIIAPNKDGLRQREIWYKARAAKINQLERLIEEAVDATEAGIWREMISNLKS